MTLARMAARAECLSFSINFTCATSGDFAAPRPIFADPTAPAAERKRSVAATPGDAVLRCSPAEGRVSTWERRCSSTLRSRCLALSAASVDPARCGMAATGLGAVRLAGTACRGRAGCGIGGGLTSGGGCRTTGGLGAGAPSPCRSRRSSSSQLDAGDCGRRSPGGSGLGGDPSPSAPGSSRLCRLFWSQFEIAPMAPKASSTMTVMSGSEAANIDKAPTAWRRHLPCGLSEAAADPVPVPPAILSRMELSAWMFLMR
jgi:hypothetical protein